mmetsp:Transcript_69177/g.195024  ORF Transcript_69177/g.195024 Transcript_69177/m.195024 type:complete len:207 (+) Transcript_69177:1123-1743(+)
MHSSRPFFTAAEIDASSMTSPSLSSPTVTVPRMECGARCGGLGISSAPSSDLTSSLFTPGSGGPAGGEGRSPASSCLTPMPGVKGAFLPLASSSCFTAPRRGGCWGGWGASAASSESSSCMAARSALGANLRLNTRTKSSWPRKILTAALASTVPESVRTKSAYWSCLPHSVKRDFTAARNVDADISSCSVGVPRGTLGSFSSPSS